MRLLFGILLLFSLNRSYAKELSQGSFHSLNNSHHDNLAKWYWQLQGKLRIVEKAKIYDIDLFDTTQKTIKELHNRGKFVICYFSAGTYENWRPDSKKFTSYDLGGEVDGWKDELWLDIRSKNVKRIMLDRLDLAKTKGCDGVEPDNVDGYANNTKFPLTAQDQRQYNIFLAQEAHKRGLKIGLKNDVDQIKFLAPFFDFAINEECFQYHECEKYKPFIKENKSIFNAEYRKYDRNICKKAKTFGISTAFYNRDLNGKKYRFCP